MIKLTTARKPVGAEPEVWINIDDISLLQRQKPVDGTDFTAVFFNLSDKPPYMPHEIAALIAQARKDRKEFNIHNHEATT